MSCTEIYSFDNNGNAHLYGSVANAWRGAMAVWTEMESRYLPLFIPEYVKACNWYEDGMGYEDIVPILGYTPSRLSPVFHGKSHEDEIWKLADDPNVPYHDRIVLASTFDNILVKKEDLPKLIEFFKGFGGETSLPEQAEILQKAYDDPDVIAVGFNQTSVNADTWTNAGGRDPETDEWLPYNCLTMDKHTWLFDEEGVNNEQGQ